MVLSAFPVLADLKSLIERARDEDLHEGDVTSRLLIEADALATGVLIQKQPGVIAGLPIVEMVCKAYDSKLQVKPVKGLSLQEAEGRFSSKTPVRLLQITGPLRSMLSAERVILNFLQRISGVATLTHQYVQAISGTAAKIYDTRKTIPGFRLLDKYAVRAGGGCNHRMGLYDGLLVKDNHLASHPLDKLAAFVADIVGHSRMVDPRRFIEIEVDTLQQLEQVLKVDAIDVILLDNMDCATMSRAVKLRDQAGRHPTTALEASGGITLQNVADVAKTGVERIAIGALTHSASALDVSLEVAGH